MARATEKYDLLIVGGGINGAGIARDAVGRGLKVLLVEKDDLAQHTSSSSTKLIHGGLRYLEHYDFALVRKALAEREVLLRAAPHIIWPMRFVLPHQKGQRPAWLVRIGLFLYDHMGGRKLLPPTKVLRRKSSKKFDPLKPELKFAFEYSDCWVDDARLVVLNAIDAAERGADVWTQSKCVSLTRSDSQWQADIARPDGQIQKVEARIVINAAGPWVDDVAKIAQPGRNMQHVRLVKGSHIIIEKKFEGSHSYFFQNGDGRIMFAIPYQEGRLTLIGTTDEPYTADKDKVEISEAEIDYLISGANEYFKEAIVREDIVSTYSGVRPLYDDQNENVSEVTRDYVLAYEKEGGAPILSVFGGKITTYRTLAEGVMKTISDAFPNLSADWTKEQSLPGGDIPNADFEAFGMRMRAQYGWMEQNVLRRMLRCYGSRIDRVLNGASSIADLGQHFGEGLYAKEVEYLVEHEFVTRVEDVLWRRSKLGLRMNEAQQIELQNWFSSKGM
ncbi:glycerol-3-phosphate dehydrogenase [Hirschia litorea]|uniref:Glycerol-3-phosphate dehydrogenase n=1 Tax=Hirschia litorea TaxID=1199156 RepID=A0ABW2IN47_9PROT